MKIPNTLVPPLVSILLSLIFLVTVAGAAQKSGNAGASRTTPSESRAPQFITGKVVETMNSGGYTYLLLEKDNKTQWVAIPQDRISVGDEVKLNPGINMADFKSRTLNRTFPKIIFSSGPAAGPGKVTDTTRAFRAHGIDPHAGIKNMPGHEIKAPEKFKGNVKVEKAEGPGSYTIAQLYEKKDELAGQQVVIAGRVVKISKSILGKNWIHIQDGSGSAAKRNNDLVVTSRDTPAAGDVVTVTGTFNVDRDFGAGYRYSVIVEDAVILPK